MIKGSTLVKKSKKSIEDELRREFILSCSDETFRKLCNRLKASDELLMKYTSKLEETTCELKNCSKCKGINNCKNEVEGHIYFPVLRQDYLEFTYKPCKYYKQNAKNNKTVFFSNQKVLENASLSEIIIEKERSKILKYIKDFIKKKLSGESVKGLYLSGPFGCGKSYIISAVLNELSNKGFVTVNVYYPYLLQRLKASFQEYNYDEVIDEVMNADILLLDDIGAENNSAWSRDEVLGTILQYRMDNNLTTFFTSNFTIEELEKVLSETKDQTDYIKARRIIERIKYLTQEEILLSKNKRN